MDPLLIPCPKCGRALRLRDRSKLGKTGKCPKCTHHFILQQPDEVQMELVDTAPASARSAAQPAVGTSARWIPDDPVTTAPLPLPPVSINEPVPTQSVQSSPDEFHIQLTGDDGTDRLTYRKRRGSKKTVFGIAAGVFAIGCAAVALMLASGADLFPQAGQGERKRPPKNNRQFQAEKQDLKDQLAVARKDSPTHGEPIQLLYLPSGARFIVNVHPAALWQVGTLGEEFRFCLGTGINSWAEEQLQEICRFQPAEIDEALICLIFGKRGTSPETAAVVRLVEEPGRVELILSFAAERNDSFGRQPVYLNDDHAFVIIDGKTFAVGPRDSAREMITAMKFPQATDEDIAALIRHTDRDRHLTVIFEPFDLRNYQDVLVPVETRAFLNLLIDWFGEDVSTVAWSIHLGEETFHSELLLRNDSISSPRRLNKEFSSKLEQLPRQVLGAVSKMDPVTLGHRKIIGRFPAMVYGYSVSTIGGIGDRFLQLTTSLPERAAPNLASGLVLTWVESLRTDFTKQAPDVSQPKLPELLADRLKLKIAVKFRRTPLYQAFASISEESHVPFKLDGDALKAKGMTQNMAQNHKLGDVSAMQAILAIIGNYKAEGMCVVIDEQAKLATVMTLTAVDERGIKESSTVKIIRPVDK